MKKLFPAFVLALLLSLGMTACKKDKPEPLPEMPGYTKTEEEAVPARLTVEDPTAFMDEVVSEALSYINMDDILPLIRQFADMDEMRVESKIMMDLLADAADGYTGEEPFNITLDIFSGEYTIVANPEKPVEYDEYGYEIYDDSPTHHLERTGDLAQAIRVKYTMSDGTPCTLVVKWNGALTDAFEIMGLPVLFPRHLELFVLQNGQTLAAAALDFAEYDPSKASLNVPVKLSGRAIVGAQMLELSETELQVIIKDGEPDITAKGFNLELYGMGGHRLGGFRGDARVFAGTTGSDSKTVVKMTSMMGLDIRHKLFTFIIMNGFEGVDGDWYVTKAQAEAAATAANNTIMMTITFGSELSLADPDVKIDVATDYKISSGYRAAFAAKLLSEDYKVPHFIGIKDDYYLTIDNFPNSYYKIMKILGAVEATTGGE